ncbi:MAG: hypothetical protein GX864_01800 [Mollicutes bacterium]|jgi:uncharacterized membrane protein (UPF0127 family)|nr:hypothetical protein [Mollicutes bacterium]
MKNKIVTASSFKKRLIGLMFDKQRDIILYLPNCNGIHTFFMQYNLDILVLDEKNIIIEMHLNVKKNRIIKIKRAKKMTSILEIPSHLGYHYRLFHQFFF